MFAERFRLRRNWLNGYCNVRTFEGHTQGEFAVQNSTSGCYFLSVQRQLLIRACGLSTCTCPNFIMSSSESFRKGLGRGGHSVGEALHTP